MAVALYLVRHGQAAAGWDVDPDPGLSEQGVQQALDVRDCFAAQAPVELVSSPLRRAVQTAGPLAQAWQSTLHIDPVFREIPAPQGISMQDRIGWLLSIRDQDWGQASDELWRWRDAIQARLQQIEQPAIIFTHFMVMNLVAGIATGCERMVHYQPANGSVLSLTRSGDVLQIADWGAQAPSRVL